MSIHTIQLVTPPLTHKRFKQSYSQAYDLVRQKCCRVIRKANHIFTVSISNAKGIEVTFINSTIPYLSIKINPAIMLGGGYLDLCRITLETFERCAAAVDGALELLKIDLTCSQLILSRIDCTVDIDFPYENGIVDFLGCVRHTKLVGGYQTLQFPPNFANYEETNLHSFRAACGDVCLTAYDKSYQLLEKGLMDPAEIPSDRLRLEAAFTNGAFQRLFSRYGRYVTYDTLGKRIVWFSDMSVRLVREYFEKTLIPGEYLRYDLALERINQSTFTLKTKDRMKNFLYEVSRHYKTGIPGAIAAFQKRGFSIRKVKYILDCFESLDLNPVTICGSSKFEYFPSISALLYGKNALPASVS